MYAEVEESRRANEISRASTGCIYRTRKGIDAGERKAEKLTAASLWFFFNSRVSRGWRAGGIDCANSIWTVRCSKFPGMEEEEEVDGNFGNCNWDCSEVAVDEIFYDG